jgi:hypothetical protein
MCVDYLSASKETTSCKFLFNGFLSIKYSAKGGFSSLRYFCPDALFFIVYQYVMFFRERGVTSARSRDCVDYRLKSRFNVISVTFRIIYAIKAI